LNASEVFTLNILQRATDLVALAEKSKQFDSKN